MLRSVSVETYERELERYGGPAALSIVEAIFGADSRAAVELLRLRLERRITSAPEVLAALSLDDLLAALGLDTDARLRWYRTRVPSRHEVGQLYREHKAVLRALLSSHRERAAERSDGTSPAPAIPDEIARVLMRRRHELRRHAEALSDMLGPLDRTESAEIVGSVLHMHCNRLLGTDTAAERRALGLLLRTSEGLARTTVQ